MINDTILSWDNIMAKLTIHPRAVAKHLLTTLDGIKPLSAKDEAAIIRSIENAGIPNGVERMLADLSRNTLRKVLQEF